MKKTLVILATIILFSINAFSQAKLKDGILQKVNLEKIYITDDISLHFVSPEPIQYVDLSSKNMLGDMPVKNILRVKYVPNKVKGYGFVNHSLGIVTIVGEKFIAQYDVWYTENQDDVQTQIEILPKNTNPLDVGTIEMSQNDLHLYALQGLKGNTKSHVAKSSAFGMEAQVNNIYTVDDYVFIDVTYTNNTNLKYDIDEFNFKIDDKRITKATNVQSVEIKPVYQLYEKADFKKKYRNIFAFKKFTFPNDKVLSIELSEKQISGRVLNLKVKYSDVLNADTL